MDRAKGRELAVVMFTKAGMDIALRLQKNFPAQIYAQPRHMQEGFHERVQSISEWTSEHFHRGNVLVYIGALGIAVRAIAPFIQGKTTDPAVICVGENGRFVIPVLSGHMGGANAYALEIAQALRAQVVLTTASDQRGLLAVDEWARKKHFVIENPDGIVHIASAILEDRLVGLLSDKELSDAPDGLTHMKTGELGVYVGAKICRPFQQTLWVRPPVLTLGIGCKRGVTAKQIDQTIQTFLIRHQYSMCSVARLVSIDQKKNEEGLIQTAQKYGWPFITYSADQLMEQSRGEGFSSSSFVQRTVGVDCVCERAAYMHGELKVRKTIFADITLALAEERGEKF